nr:hypothetical protein [Tanacetum cinerariifolium]
MLDVHVQHEVPSIQTSPVLTIPVIVIPKPSIIEPSVFVTAAPATTIPPILPSFFPTLQQSTPIPTPTTTESTTSTPVILESTTLSAIHQRVYDLKKEVKILRNVDHNSIIRAVIKSEVPIVVRECLGTNMEDSYHKIKMEQPGKHQEIKYTITSSDKVALKEYDQKRTLFETMTKTKSFNKHPKHKALYHSLIELIITDEEALDRGVVDPDKQKKMKPDDVDRDEDPLAGSDQGLKRRKTSKDTEPLKRSKSISSSKATEMPQNQGEYIGTTNVQPNVEAAPKKDWFKEPKRHPTPDSEWNQRKMSTPIDFFAFAMNCLQISNLTKVDLVRPVYNLLKCTCKSYVELEYNMEECYKALNDQLDWNNPEGDRYPFNLSKPLPLVESRNCLIVPVDYFFNNDLVYLQRGSIDRKYTTSLTNTKAAKYDLQGIKDMVPMLWSPIKVSYDRHALLVTNVKVNKWYGCGHLEKIKALQPQSKDIVHLAATLRMFTRRIVIQKRVEDLQLGVKSYQKKLNIRKPRTCDEDLSQRVPYTTLSNRKGDIYEDKMNKERLMRSDKLHKFSDEHQSNIYIFTMTMEILPDPSSDKLCVSMPLMVAFLDEIHASMDFRICGNDDVAAMADVMWPNIYAAHGILWSTPLRV